MSVTPRLSQRLLDVLGVDAATELTEYLNAMDLAYRTELRALNESNFIRFDAKLEQRLAEWAGGLRTEFHREIAGLRTELQQQIGAVKAELQQQIGAVKAELQQQIGTVKADLQQQIGAVHTGLHQQAGGLRAELHKEVGELRAEIHKTRAELTRWMGGVLVTSVLTLVGLMAAFLRLSW